MRLFQNTVDAGRTHSCATKSASTSAWCWGSNGSSELGNATTDTGQTPTALTEAGWTRLLPGNQYSCGLRTDDSLWCWGIPYSGQTGGNGSFGNKAAVTPPSTWSSATTGGEHGCGIRPTGALWCWGRSDFGQVGHGVTELNVPPTVIASGSQWRSVSAGELHTCGVRQDGTAWCWGDNGNGELGVGNTDNKSVPTQVGPPPP
jgi:alpha-tubulin suppressor-like RCC1 family protein